MARRWHTIVVPLMVVVADTSPESHTSFVSETTRALRTACGEDVACLLREMTLEEKLRFFAGDLDAIDHITGVSRLGIPDINMGDGPNGVANTIPGTTTSFPCNLAVGNTFDHALARDYGSAMAREFKAKGKNQILGPGVNLARLPQLGRLDEYITGEDPVLGAELVKEVVRGALDEHVMTCIKHFVNNDQETNRNDWSANPDTNVQMEYYMKPFFAAIEAGAASLMCGYNKVHGMPACQNSGIMQAAKKVAKSFWIVGDWGAVYPEDEFTFAAKYVNAGLDMEMGAHDDPSCQGPDVPPTKYGAGGYCNKGDYMLPGRMQAMLDNGAVSTARIDETVERVLTALKTAGLLRPSVQNEFPTFTQKDLHSKWFGPLMQKDVRTQHSRQVAQNVATSAIVLLQNREDLLPLGNADKIETYGCGDEVHFHVESGSASGTAPHMPTVPCKPASETACPFPEDGLKAGGASVQGFRLADAQSGPRDASATAVICLMASAKNSEGTDRANLDLMGADTFPFEKFAHAAVVVFSPGPVLMPFTSKVKSIILVSLPGEMGGAAIADVLLGQASPTGHLSVTMPNRMDETPVRANPVADDYAEDFEVAYRWYDAHDNHPNFGFGWGLSYAKYMQVVDAKLLEPSGDQRPRVRVVLRRDTATGTKFDGPVDQVVQLYIQHQAPRERSFQELAGFGKVRGLRPGVQSSIEIGFDAPKTWGSQDGDKNGYGADWEPVTRYTVSISLHGVEEVFMICAVELSADGLTYTVVPTHHFDTTGPLKFDQGLAVSEWARARGVHMQEPGDHVWDDVQTAYSQSATPWGVAGRSANRMGFFTLAQALAGLCAGGVIVALGVAFGTRRWLAARRALRELLETLPSRGVADEKGLEALISPEAGVETNSEAEG